MADLPQLPPDLTPLSFLDALYRWRFSGQVVLHLQNGIPRLASFGPPQTVPLRDPTTDLSPALDNSAPSRAG